MVRADNQVLLSYLIPRYVFLRCGIPYRSPRSSKGAALTCAAWGKARPRTAVGHAGAGQGHQEPANAAEPAATHGVHLTAMQNSALACTGPNLE